MRIVIELTDDQAQQVRRARRDVGEGGPDAPNAKQWATMRATELLRADLVELRRVELNEDENARRQALEAEMTEAWPVPGPDEELPFDPDRDDTVFPDEEDVVPPEVPEEEAPEEVVGS